MLDMQSHSSATADQAQETLGLTGVLRQCLATAMVAVDSHQRVTGFNQVAASLTGLVPAQVLNHPLDVLPPPLQAVVRETFDQGQAIADREIALPRDGGASVALLVNTTADRDPQGRVRSVVLIFHDLTSARRMESSTRQLDRLASIGTLSSGVAHEIKNALVVMKTFTDLSHESNQDTELTNLMRHEISRISSLVTHLLKFAGPAKTEFAPVSLHEVLNGCLRLVQHQVESKGVHLVRSLRAAHDRIAAHDNQIEQALLNLLLNAIDALTVQGTLTVMTQLVAAPDPSLPANGPRKPGSIQVCIQDNGEGIPAENLARLFEPFFTTKPHGTGLGLVITRRILQEHGGTISVESELKKGTTFTLTLPLLPTGPQ